MMKPRKPAAGPRSAKIAIVIPGKTYALLRAISDDMQREPAEVLALALGLFDLARSHAADLPKQK